VEVQLHVLVERFGNAGGNDNAFAGLSAGGLLRDVEPALDFADVIGVLIETGAISRAEILLEARQAFCNRIENAAVLLTARGAFGRTAAVSEKLLEDDLRIQFHRQRLCRRRP